MTLQEIKDFLKDHANDDETKAFLSELSKPDRTALERMLLETDDGKAVFSSLYDKRHKKFEEEKLPSLVSQKLEEEKKKAAIGQGASQSALANDPAFQELLGMFKKQSERLEQFEKGTTKSTRLEKVLKIFDEKKIPAKARKYAEALIADDDDETIRRATEFADDYVGGIEEATKARLGESGYTPPRSAPPSDDDKLSDAEYYRKQDQKK